jgi:predicted amidophosphoribosyltransferase
MSDEKRRIVSAQELETIRTDPAFQLLLSPLFSIVLCPYCGTKNNFIYRDVDTCWRCGGPCREGEVLVGKLYDEAIYIKPAYTQ